HVAGRARPGNIDAVGVETDGVGPADRVVRRAVLDQHAIAVAQIVTAGVGADVVAQHHVAGRARPGNIDAGAVVTDGVGPADRVVRRVVDVDAIGVVAGVAQLGTVGVGTDEVALHHVTGC